MPSSALAQSQRSDTTAQDVRINGPLVSLGTPGEVLNENSEGKQLSLGVEDRDIRIDWTLAAEDRQRASSMRVSEVRIRGYEGEQLFDRPKALHRLLP